MLTIKRVNATHILALDPNTDASHLLHVSSSEPILTFDSNTVCRNRAGEIVARIELKANEWLARNELGIKTTPVSFHKTEGVFDVEADFCQQWLKLQT